jgi:hypothetical protein
MKSYFNNCIDDLNKIVDWNNNDMTSFKMEVSRLYDSIFALKIGMDNYFEVFIRELEQKDKE